MIFQKERELQSELEVTSSSEWGNHDLAFTKREVPIGECIPDFIYVGYKSTPTMNNWPNRWNAKYSFILALLREHGSLTGQEIASICFEEIETISPILLFLEKHEIITRSLNEKYTLSEKIAQIDAEIVAIEAKLTDWREAFHQAVRYQQFADKVIVAMDAEGIPRDDKSLELFKACNIGLCAISFSNIEWLIQPGRNNPTDTFNKEYIVNSTLIPSRQILWTRR